ncbi:MAG: DUF4190 domain-containing protein [Gloeobacteraceae cyanobacterium ES-bin-144]|nr:DUF4190 domain-containing protein [Verrucomicrobiales bacterium]
MQWYYSKNTTQLGPITDSELKAKVSSGEISRADLIWKDGMRDWLPVSSVPELSGIPLHAQGMSPYAPPNVPGGMMMGPRTSGLAIASLVCGICGLFCLFLPGIAAVICGHMALARIYESSRNPIGQLQGRGMAIAGLVTGYISVVILMFYFIALMFFTLTK